MKQGEGDLGKGYEIRGGVVGDVRENDRGSSENQGRGSREKER